MGFHIRVSCPSGGQAELHVRKPHLSILIGIFIANHVAISFKHRNVHLEERTESDKLYAGGEQAKRRSS